METGGWEMKNEGGEDILPVYQAKEGTYRTLPRGDLSETWRVVKGMKNSWCT